MNIQERITLSNLMIGGAILVFYEKYPCNPDGDVLQYPRFRTGPDVQPVPPMFLPSRVERPRKIRLCMTVHVVTAQPPAVSRAVDGPGG